MNFERFQLVMFYLSLFLIFALCFLLVKPFLHIIGWAIILAVISYPLYKRLKNKINNQSIAALITCLLTVAVAIVPCTTLSLYVAKEGVKVASHIKTKAHKLKQEDKNDLKALQVLNTLETNLKKYTKPFNIELNIEKTILDKTEQISSILIQQSVNLAGDIVSSIVKLFIILLTFYFLLRDFPKLKNTIEIFTPLDDEQTTKLLNKVGDTIHTTVYVTLIVAITQGTLGGLGFWFLGIKSPLLWGMVMAIFCLIPLLGHPFIWAPVAIYFVLNGLYLKAILLTLWGMLVIGLIDNFIRTFLIGAKVQLHPLIVFFGVLGGVLLLGPIGLLLGPVIIVVAFFLIEILKVKLDYKESEA